MTPRRRRPRSRRATVPVVDAAVIKDGARVERARRWNESDKLVQIRAGRRVFVARFALTDRESPHYPGKRAATWSRPFHIKLRVTRNADGMIASMRPEAVPGRQSAPTWAAYTEADYLGQGEFMSRRETGDWRMRLCDDFATAFGD